jgi:hypothetical protein
VSSYGTGGSTVEASHHQTDHRVRELETDVARLTAELNQARRAEQSVRASYQQLTEDRALVSGHSGALHTRGDSRAEEGQELLKRPEVLPAEGQGEDEEKDDDEGEGDGGSSVASFGSALDDGAGASDPRVIAAAAVAESARLRQELGAARAEGAAALAMEHGRRTAVVEAHRSAHATTIRQAAELRDAHSEIASLRRRLTYEAVGCGMHCSFSTRPLVVHPHTSDLYKQSAACAWLCWQSARAELEQQLSVAIDDAKGLAAEAVSRQRRAVAQATTAEKALFARGELQVLAEAAAATATGE